MNGLFKGLLRLGCLVAALGAAVAAWRFREPIVRTAARWFGPAAPALPPVIDTAVGAPTPGALASGRSKLDVLGQPGGPDSVILNANEMASLLGSGIDWRVRKTFDSLRVELLEDEFSLHTRLDTRQLPPDALGPLRGMLEPREPLRLDGTLAIERAGVARWTIRGLALRGLALPSPVVRQLVRQAAGADGAGAIPLTVDRAIGDVAIHPTGVVLYRRRRE